MAKSKRGLGRGLEALFPAPAPPVREGLIEVEVERIEPNPRQPRHSMDPRALQELTDSIREHGLLQPLIVTEAGEGYQLIAGERRWAAARMAGLSRVPVVVKEATPREMLELALVENLQRADLNPLEAAGAYRQLMDDFGLTQEEVAARVGKNRATVANTLRLLRLPDEVKRCLAEGEITEGHARALLPLEVLEDQLNVMRAILRRGLSVRQTEEMVRRLAAPPKPSARDEDVSPETKALEDQFRETLGTKVQLFRSKRGGRLVIHFYSEEELQGLYELIVGE